MSIEKLIEDLSSKIEKNTEVNEKLTGVLEALINQQEKIFEPQSGKDGQIEAPKDNKLDPVPKPEKADKEKKPAKKTKSKSKAKAKKEETKSEDTDETTQFSAVAEAINTAVSEHDDGRQAVKSVFKEFDVKTANELLEDQYDEFIETLTAELDN